MQSAVVFRKAGLSCQVSIRKARVARRELEEGRHLTKKKFDRSDSLRAAGFFNRISASARRPRYAWDPERGPATAGNRDEERQRILSNARCWAEMAVRIASEQAGFYMPRDDNTRSGQQRCPICQGPMQVVCPESGVPGLPPGIRRHIIRCLACELVTFQTLALEREP
jgi:hypothetical protein